MGIVVAIDGPSGAGKSSAAKAIAHRAGWNYLDTGALYRAVTWLALENKCDEAFSIVQLLKDHPIRFEADPTSPQVFAGDVQITQSIRGHSVTENVSRISAMPEIRKQLFISVDLPTFGRPRIATIGSPRRFLCLSSSQMRSIVSSKFRLVESISTASLALAIGE